MPADVLLNTTFDWATGSTTVYRANSDVNQNTSMACASSSARRLSNALPESGHHTRARLLVAAGNSTGVDVSLVIDVIGSASVSALALAQSYANFLIHDFSSINLAAFSQAVAGAGGSTADQSSNFGLSNVVVAVASATPVPSADSDTDWARTNAIIGGVIGGAAGLVLIAVLVLLALRTHRRHEAAKSTAASAGVAAPSSVEQQPAAAV